MTSTPEDIFNEMWEERKSSPDFLYDGADTQTDIPEYDVMDDPYED
jgi:hypothetical protein